MTRPARKRKARRWKAWAIVNRSNERILAAFTTRAEAQDYKLIGREEYIVCAFIVESRPERRGEGG